MASSPKRMPDTHGDLPSSSSIIVFSGSGEELRSRPDLIETAYLEGIAKALAE